MQKFIYKGLVAIFCLTAIIFSKILEDVNEEPGKGYYNGMSFRIQQNSRLNRALKWFVSIKKTDDQEPMDPANLWGHFQ